MGDWKVIIWEIMIIVFIVVLILWVLGH
jgi:hypothetical protein